MPQLASWHEIRRNSIAPQTPNPNPAPETFNPALNLCKRSSISLKAPSRGERTNYPPLSPLKHIVGNYRDMCIYIYALMYLFMYVTTIKLEGYLLRASQRHEYSMLGFIGGFPYIWKPPNPESTNPIPLELWGLRLTGRFGFGFQFRKAMLSRTCSSAASQQLTDNPRHLICFLSYQKLPSCGTPEL